MGDASRRESAETWLAARYVLGGKMVKGSDNFFKRFPHQTRAQVTMLLVLMPDPGESPLVLTDWLMFILAQALPEEMPDAFKVPI